MTNATRKLKRRRAQSSKPSRSTSFATNIPLPAKVPEGLQSWPIAKAFVPRPEAWGASGWGAAGVVRERPDGAWASAFFGFAIEEGGLQLAFGKEREDPEGTLRLLRDVGAELPPVVEGPVELAAVYVWGAHALAARNGVRFPDDEMATWLAMVPKPPGGARQWVDALVGRGGLTPPGVLKVLRENPLPDDMPAGKSVMIVTRTRFRTAAAGDVTARLDRARPEFFHGRRAGDGTLFDWSRGGKPGLTGLFTGRKTDGVVLVSGDRVTAETYTLSMASRLVGRLVALCGDHLAIEGTTWQSPSDWMQGAALGEDR